MSFQNRLVRSIPRWNPAGSAETFALMSLVEGNAAELFAAPEPNAVHSAMSTTAARARRDATGHHPRCILLAHAGPAIDQQNVSALEAILRVWLEDPELMLFCGAWSNGAIMELLPHGKARLTGQLYAGRFAGLRDLILDDGGHHVHLDLGRLDRACYLVAPSVCFGFRPSFELRIAAAGADPLCEFGLGLAVRHPYDNGGLRESAVMRYFARVAQHLRMHPGTASLAFKPRGSYHEERDADWSAIERLLTNDPALQHLRAHLPLTVAR